MTQHSVRLHLHMGCGESLCSRWLPNPGPAARKMSDTARAARKPAPVDHRRERTRR